MAPYVHARFEALRRELVASPRVWLVTGVAGFIGSNLLEELLGLGQTVIGLDNFSTGHQSNIESVIARQPAAASRLRFIAGDIRDVDVCRHACVGVDYVLHQAALGSVPRSIADPVTTNQVNIDGFLHMLVAARDAGAKRFIYASSSSVYGDCPELPQVEDRTGRPLSPYAATKATGEMYAEVFQRTYGLRTIGLRYFNVFGKRQDPNGAYAAVIPRWVSNLLSDEPCRVFGDGETSRDFCFVANVVQANLLAAAQAPDTAHGRAYNIACGESTSLNTLFQLLRDGLATSRPSLRTAQPLYEGFRPGDILHSYADITNARARLGYEPTHRLADGLDETLAWYAATLSPGK